MYLGRTQFMVAETKFATFHRQVSWISNLEGNFPPVFFWRGITMWDWIKNYLQWNITFWLGAKIIFQVCIENQLCASSVAHLLQVKTFLHSLCVHSLCFSLSWLFFLFFASCFLLQASWTRPDKYEVPLLLNTLAGPVAAAAAAHKLPQ